MCARLHSWVLSPTRPLGSQISELRKAASEFYTVYWPLRRHPWSCGWWEFSTFPLGTLGDFHMWVAVSLNQTLSDWENGLWRALSLPLLSTAQHSTRLLLLAFQPTWTCTLLCPVKHLQKMHWTIYGQHLKFCSFSRRKMDSHSSYFTKTKLYGVSSGDAGLFVTDSIFCSYNFTLWFMYTQNNDKIG